MVSVERHTCSTLCISPVTAGSHCISPASARRSQCRRVCDYTEKAPDAVSWYRPHLETSLALIEQAAAGSTASVIDVGGGESTLVDDLLVCGYEKVTVLDISQAAIDANRRRLGEASERKWQVRVAGCPTLW